MTRHTDLVPASRPDGNVNLGVAPDQITGTPASGGEGAVPAEMIDGLHPDLVAAVNSGSASGLWFVQHPLLHTILAPAHFLNPLYERRQAALQAALQADDYKSVFYTYESPYRLAVLRDIADFLEDDERRYLLGVAWTTCEFPSAYDTEDLVDLFERIGFVTDSPWSAPGSEMTIYRGGHREGMSWTSDIQIAADFRIRLGRDEDLWRATVNGGDVLGLFADRSEFEVVVNPDTLFDAATIQPPPRDPGNYSPA